MTKKIVHRAFSQEQIDICSKDKRNQTKTKIISIIKNNKEGVFSHQIAKELSISIDVTEQYLRELISDGNWGARRKREGKKYIYFYHSGFPTSLLTEKEKEKIKKMKEDKRKKNE
tara:strand:- start:12 stop:356 length:345 start_codon:yes stop_codon:yes gene_type:complete